MNDKNASTDSNVSLRSPLEAYAPVIVVGIIIAFALVALFSTANSMPKGDETPPPAQNAPPKPDQTKRLQEISERIKGDWNKATKEEQDLMNEFSQGHGKEMLEMKSRAGKPATPPPSATATTAK